MGLEELLDAGRDVLVLELGHGREEVVLDLEVEVRHPPVAPPAWRAVGRVVGRVERLLHLGGEEARDLELLHRVARELELGGRVPRQLEPVGLLARLAQRLRRRHVHARTPVARCTLVHGGGGRDQQRLLAQLRWPLVEQRGTAAYLSVASSPVSASAVASAAADLRPISPDELR